MPGVNAVTESPMEKAALKADAYLAGVQRAVQSGKYAANLRKVTLSDWKQAMLKKGIQNMQNGYMNSKAKFTRFMTDFLPFARSVSDQIKAMPKGTIQQGKDRMMKVIDLMAGWGAQDPLR